MKKRYAQLEKSKFEIYEEHEMYYILMGYVSSNEYPYCKTEYFKMQKCYVLGVVYE